MVTVDIFTKHKNKVLNIGIIILAIITASYIYSSQNQALISLSQKKDQEIKKNSVLESISRVEKKADAYKKFFAVKELGEVVDALTNIAKDTRVQLLSVKPGAKEKHPEYIKTSFLISVRARDYHALGAFVNKLENYKDLYLVEDMNINPSNPDVSGSNDDRQLNVNLRISTVSYL